VGTNKRYADHYDKLWNQKQELELLKPKPLTLTDAELDIVHHPVTTTQNPVTVDTWVRYEQVPVRTRAQAFEWNDRAVHVRWKSLDGEDREAWVWASSVTPFFATRRN
jgi:hypothetical protein